MSEDECAGFVRRGEDDDERTEHVSASGSVSMRLEERARAYAFRREYY